MERVHRKPQRQPRNERLNETLFSSPTEARKTLDAWREDYNWLIPLPALGDLAPKELAEMRKMDKLAA